MASLRDSERLLTRLRTRRTLRCPYLSGTTSSMSPAAHFTPETMSSRGLGKRQSARTVPTRYPRVATSMHSRGTLV